MGQRSRVWPARGGKARVAAALLVVWWAALPQAVLGEDAAKQEATEPTELTLEADAVEEEPGEEAEANRDESEPSSDDTNAEDADAEDVNRGKDHPERIRLTAMLSTVYMNASIHFDEHGEERHRSESMYINASILPPAGKTVLKYRIEKYHDMVTSTGEKIELNNRHHHHGDHWQEFNRHHHNRDEQLRMSLHIERPRIPAQRIKRVAADIELKVSEGPKMRVELAPVEKYFDKDIRIKNIEDCQLRMERKAKDRLRVEYRGEGWENLDEVRFLDKAGNELPSRGWSGGGLHPGTGYWREYRFEMPDGGKVIVDIWKGVRVVPGLFELKDVPLPGAPSPEDEVDISRSEPASPPAAKTPLPTAAA